MRLEVAVIERDGSAKVVNAARPATLVAFTDEHEGKTMPESVREIAWVVHHALGITEPLEEWLAGLEDISAMPEDVALAKRVMAGDEEARKIALGEVENPNTTALLGGVMGEAENGNPTDPAVEQVAAMSGERP